MNNLYDLISSFIVFFISLFIDIINMELNYNYWIPYSFGSIIGNFIGLLFSIKSTYKYLTITLCQHIFNLIILNTFSSKIGIIKSILYIFFNIITDNIGDNYIMINNTIQIKNNETYTLKQKKKFKLLRSVLFIILIEIITKYYINVIDIVNIIKVILGYIIFKQLI